MCNRLISLLTLLIFAALPGYSQDENPLTLNAAISLSLKNSHQLKISQARIDKALAKQTAARQARLPDFKISGSYLRLSSAKLNLKLGSGDSASHGGPKIPSVNQALYGTANLTLPLYAGGKIKYGIESARLLAEAVQLDAVSDTQSIILNTVASYVNLYKAAATISLLKENLTSSQSRDSTFTNLEKNGLLARNDLLKSQLQTSNIELALLNAETEYRDACMNMNLMLGLPETDSLRIDPEFINHPMAISSYLNYENAALQSRGDVKATNYRIKAAKTAIKLAKADVYPTIGLTAGYIAADIPKVFSVTNAVNAGIGIQYNLSNLWKSNTNLKEAQAQQREIEAHKALLLDDIRLQTNHDYQALLLGNKKIEVYEKALEQASENFRIISNKYQNSLATLTDLLDADVARLQAKINISMAKADLVLAYNKLLQTAGQLKAN